MKNILKLSLIITLIAVSACSFANRSTVIVPINSNPPGADVVIDGQNFGQTPAFVELKPSKNYQATISKSGYGSANINMETWYSMRDGKDGDGGRCMADIGAFVLPYFIVLAFAPEKCASFKQSDYFVNLMSTSNKGQNQTQTNNNYKANQPDQYKNHYQPGAYKNQPGY